MFAVVDTETTGLSPSSQDRIVEIAIVHVDADGQITDRWHTLVNPERHVGLTRVHGIRDSDVTDAPTFADIASEVVERLRGRVLVCHNLTFDHMFLSAEFQRLGGRFPASKAMSLCTMELSGRLLPGVGRSLADCCDTASVPYTAVHTAIGDATATAGLLAHLLHLIGDSDVWTQYASIAASRVWPDIEGGTKPAKPRSTQLEGLHGEPAGLVASLVDFMPRVAADELSDPYLAVLDQALADRYLSEDEGAALQAIAAHLGFDEWSVTTLHCDYLDALARVALADHQVSEVERQDLQRVASTLKLPSVSVAASLNRAAASGKPLTANELRLYQGDVVVFTGDLSEPLDVWFERATEHGFVPHPAVTKPVSLVVVGDLNNLSSTAKKARGHGIPLMSVDEFRSALGYPAPDPVEATAAS